MGKEKEWAEKLRNKYDTSDPFKICKSMSIQVFYADLGKTRGLYTYNKRNKFITINSTLAKEEYGIVCAHELGHAVLHRDSNRIYMDSIMLTRPNVEENEANRFAAHMLIPDEVLLDYRDSGFSVSQIAADLEVPKSILELKLADCRI